MSNELELESFLKLKDEELLKKYDKLSTIEQESIKRIYRACYRFALQDTQILYMISEAIRPYSKIIRLNLFKGE